MKLERIVSLANYKTKLQFLAMERSLRSVGCNLPIWVIPYDDSRFKLPTGSTWWEVPEIIAWLDSENTHPTMRKYQCFTIDNYQFVDADVCFLRNPQDVLVTEEGFITSCGHWHNPAETYTAESKEILTQQSTIWQQQIFNTGQFACDRTLYTFSQLREVAMHPSFINTCVRFKWHEQPGINLLVNVSGVEVSNLTLPPVRMQSTWAGYYPGNFEPFWHCPEHKPYLIHWAGGQLMFSRPINDLFYQYLTQQERIEWDHQMVQRLHKYNKNQTSFWAVAKRVKRAMKILLDK